jgi:hypothetical protein
MLGQEGTKRMRQAPLSYYTKVLFWMGSLLRVRFVFKLVVDFLQEAARKATKRKTMVVDYLRGLWPTPAMYSKTLVS